MYFAYVACVIDLETKARMKIKKVNVFTAAHKLLLSVLSWIQRQSTLQSFSVLFICQPTPKCKLREDVMNFMGLKEVLLQQMRGNLICNID